MFNSATQIVNLHTCNLFVRRFATRKLVGSKLANHNVVDLQLLGPQLTTGNLLARNSQQLGSQLAARWLATRNSLARILLLNLDVWQGPEHVSEVLPSYFTKYSNYQCVCWTPKVIGKIMFRVNYWNTSNGDIT